MMNGSMMWGMAFGGGLVLVLLITVLVLGIIALAKYIRGSK